MDKKNKIIISVGVVVIAIATFLIVAGVKVWNEGEQEESSGIYTLQPTTTQAIPVDTSSWIDINLIASDIATVTSDPSTTDASTDPSTTVPMSGYGQGYFFDAYGNLVDVYGNIIIPNSQLQNNGNGGGGSVVPPTSMDTTNALDVPVTEESELEEYVLDEQGMITKYLGDRTILIIPSQVQGKTVTGIGPNCFSGKNIESVQIPATVEIIENKAFANCTRLHTVTFVSESVNVSIGVSAFEGCTSLTSVRLPKVALCNMAFARCSSLKTVELAAGSNLIGAYAFSDCTSLEYVKIPSSVDKNNIHNNVFSGCPETFYVVADAESDAYTVFKDLGFKVSTHE